MTSQQQGATTPKHGESSRRTLLFICSSPLVTTNSQRYRNVMATRTKPCKFVSILGALPRQPGTYTDMLSCATVGFSTRAWQFRNSAAERAMLLASCAKKRPFCQAGPKKSRHTPRFFSVRWRTSFLPTTQKTFTSLKAARAARNLTGIRGFVLTGGKGSSKL